MHAKFERLLSKSLTILEVMAYYLVVHTGPGEPASASTAVDLCSIAACAGIFFQVESYH